MASRSLPLISLALGSLAALLVSQGLCGSITRVPRGLAVAPSEPPALAAFPGASQQTSGVISACWMLFGVSLESWSVECGVTRG